MEHLKRRNPLAVWIGLPLITLGIYLFVWYYKIHKELAAQSRDPNAPVVGPMLVILLFGWLGIPFLISFYNTGKRIRRAQADARIDATCSPTIGLLLCFVFGLAPFYYQKELNKIA